MQISDRVNRLSPSATLMMSQLSGEMRARGIDVINLSVGEPDFPTPPHINHAAQEAIDNQQTHYTPIDGILSLREAICDKLLKENGLKYKPQQIVVSSGAKQSVCNAILATINEGDEVIIPSPYWLSYPQMVKLAGGVVKSVKTTLENDYKLTPSQLEEAISERTRMIILCSPSNPTGAIYSKADLQGLAEVLLRHKQIIIISDEIYEHIRYSGEYCSLAQIESLHDRVVIINGVSKAYAMTGWRIGWMAASEELAKACKKLQGQYTSCASTISQCAAEAAYRGSQECVEHMRAVFQTRRDAVLEYAAEIPNIKYNIPQGAFYLLMDMSAYIGKSFNGKQLTSSADITRYLLEQGHVTCVDGEPFGADGSIRISFATTLDDIQESLKRIRQALIELK